MQRQLSCSLAVSTNDHVAPPAHLPFYVHGQFVEPHYSTRPLIVVPTMRTPRICWQFNFLRIHESCRFRLCDRTAPPTTHSPVFQCRCPTL